MDFYESRPSVLASQVAGVMTTLLIHAVVVGVIVLAKATAQEPVTPPPRTIIETEIIKLGRPNGVGDEQVKVLPAEKKPPPAPPPPAPKEEVQPLTPDENAPKAVEPPKKEHKKKDD